MSLASLSKYRVVSGPAAPDRSRVMLFMNPSARRPGGAAQFQTCELIESVCHGSVDGARLSMTTTALIASRSDPFTRMVVDDSVETRGRAITLDVSIGRARDIAGAMGAALVCVEGVYCDLLTHDLWTDVQIFSHHDGIGTSTDDAPAITCPHIPEGSLMMRKL
jgi:hypothetical protein